MQGLLCRLHAPSKISSYPGALVRCSARLGAGSASFGESIELYVVFLVQSSGSGSPVRCLLSALALLHKFGWSPWTSPCGGACPKLQLKDKTDLRVLQARNGFPPFESCSSPKDCVVLGACVFSFAFGFRVSEASWF